MSTQLSETRARILRAALELLEKSHGTGVRMGDIAKRAGITRQAVYLHFPTRAELLIAVTYHLDDLQGAEQRLLASRQASSGVGRLHAFIEAWANYIPDIYVVAKALLAMKDTDAAADKAWTDRMQDVREGCQAAIDALQRDGNLDSRYCRDEATDLLWTLLSVRNWEHLRLDCGWSQSRYVENLQLMARRLLCVESTGNT